MKLPRLLLVSAAALLMSGCLLGPDYQRPDTELPAAFDGATPATALPLPQNWWTLYGDEQLNQLVAAGLARNADVRLAAARVDEAEALLRESSATLFFPLLQGDAEGARERAAGVTGNSYSLSAATSFELDLWGRLRRTRGAAADTLAASQYARDTVGITLAATIARNYFALRSLDSQARASTDTLRSAEESLSLARKRADAGVTSALDVHQAESLRLSAAAQAKEIARQRNVVLHELGVLTGQLDIKLDSAEVEKLPIPALPPAGLPSELLTRRPDVREAEALLAAATERIGAAKAAQFPSLSLTGAIGSASSELDGLLKAGSEFWSVGAGITGPILDGGRYAARTDQARAQAGQAEAAYVAAVRNAFRDVADALSNVQAAADSEADLKARVDQAAQGLKLATHRYESGYSAYLEVLDSQRTLNEAQLAFIRNRQAYLSYSVDLMNALGGGWKPAQS